MAFSNQIIQRIAGAGGRLRVRSALNPGLWLCAIISVPCLALAVYVADEVPAWLLVLLAVIATAPIFVTVAGFVYFMLTDPDKLQSEEYQIKARVLEYIEEKGGVSEDERRVIEAISNPQEGHLSNRIEEDQ